MDEQIKELLGGEIKDEIENLSTLEPGSEEHSKAVENLAKLYRLKIDEAKNEYDYAVKYESQESEERHRQDQKEEQAKDRYVKIGIETAGLILPLMFYASWMRKGFRFEETGAFTSGTFRNLFNHFRPTKR